MQTFAVFLALGILGGKWGSVSILIYLALGAVGLPVFSGFQGGIGVLLGVTGGYLWGFLFSGLGYWALEKLGKPIAMIAGMLICYLCGSLWFLLYGGSAGLWVVIMKCVVPYLIPDGMKIALAVTLSRRIGKHIK
jgi:biotin transport system substrate-specific component